MPQINTDEFSTDVPWEAHQLAVDLRDGNPAMGWRGNARLRLLIGILTAPRSGIDTNLGRWVQKGQKLAWRYEVVYDNPNGTTERVGTWTQADFMRIIPDIIKMDPETPGHKPLTELVKESDARVEALRQREFDEAYGPIMEHKLSLEHDLNVGRTTFRQVGGSDERPDRNLSDAD